MTIAHFLKELNISREGAILILLLLSALILRTIYDLWGTPIIDNPSEHKLDVILIIVLFMSVFLFLFFIFLLIFT